jgi:glycosyltransferase involved in cell wall biosynthesis
MELLRRLSRHYGERVLITLFGVSPADPGFAELPQDFDWQLAGMLEAERVAALLGRTDIFVDFSTWQAMGLTALEAMAAGATVIVPENGGAASFARHGENALVVDTSSSEACWRALCSLVENEHLRAGLRANAIRDACAFFPEWAALNLLSVLFDPLTGTGDML